jgi:DNA-binding MarR family transcriptional regulator
VCDLPKRLAERVTVTPFARVASWSDGTSVQPSSSALPTTVTNFMATQRPAAVAAKSILSVPAAGVAAARAAEAERGDAGTRVLRQFRLVFNSVKTHFQQVEKLAGVGGAQVWALSIIRDRPGVGVNDLAQAMDVRQPTASNLVKALVEQGHVEVRKEGPDKRAVQLYARPSGVQVLRRVPGPFTGVLPDALATLDAETLRRLEADLDRLIKALHTDDGAAEIPLSQM